MSYDPIEDLKNKGFEVESLCHAKSILTMDFPEELGELCEALHELNLPITEIIGSGGGETKFTQRLRRTLAERSWHKHNFIIEKKVDGVPKDSTSHEIDHVRRKANVGVIACEIEWNNKDPFFDRDLENFKRLHAENAISVGVIITKGKSLQDGLSEAVYRFTEDQNIGSFIDLEEHGYHPTARQKAAVEKQTGRDKKPLNFRDAWVRNFINNKYGKSTTHWSKLLDRIERGVGHPCPLLIIGLPSSMIVFDSNPIDVLEDNEDEESSDG